MPPPVALCWNAPLLPSVALGVVVCWTACSSDFIASDATSEANAPIQAERQAVAADPSPPIPLLEPVPTPQQQAWQEMERILFIHFGINTFTGLEWGTGTENPQTFNPPTLNPRQWAEVAKNAGFQGIIFTAKHHDGFALWPSQHTDHSIKQSPWKNGMGDVVREVAEACREAGLAFGFYLSPWDRHEPTWGTPTYDDYYVHQLTELLTSYGPVFEVWLDGAHEPEIKIPAYDYQRYWNTIRTYQPETLIAILGPDVRWIGNEAGLGDDTGWSVVEGRWRPAECDVSIRPGWFWRPEEDEKVKSVRRLLSLYFSSVGRNCTLLLNVPPNDKGVFPEQDTQALLEFHKALVQIFAYNLAEGKPVTASNVRKNEAAWGPEMAIDGHPDTFWTTDDGITEGWIEVDVGSVRFNIIELQEAIAYGQRVEAYRLETWSRDGWRTIHRGTTIGYKRLARIKRLRTTKLRLVIERARGNPVITQFGIYDTPVTWD